MSNHRAVVMAIVLSMGCNTALDESPKFNITTKRDGDTVNVTAEQDKIVFSVHSSFGISQAVIERTGKNWPNTILLRLHLKGLEKFSVSNGKVTLEAAVSSPGEPSSVRQWKDGSENSLLDSESPYWMEIRLIEQDEKPATSIPLNGGYFEIQLPKALFEDNSKSIKVNWIDFYR